MVIIVITSITTFSKLNEIREYRQSCAVDNLKWELGNRLFLGKISQWNSDFNWYLWKLHCWYWNSWYFISYTWKFCLSAFLSVYLSLSTMGGRCTWHELRVCLPNLVEAPFQVPIEYIRLWQGSWYLWYLLLIVSPECCWKHEVR